jgi:uncharacterized protein
MLLTITPVYISFLILFYLALTLRVIYLRRLFRIGLGDGGNPQLQKSIRVHGNFQEFVPLTLVLLIALEINKIHPYFIHFLGTLLILGRIIHAIGVYSFSGSSLGRFCGALLNYLVLLLGSLGLCGRWMVFF